MFILNWEDNDVEGLINDEIAIADDAKDNINAG